MSDRSKYDPHPKLIGKAESMIFQPTKMGILVAFACSMEDVTHVLLLESIGVFGNLLLASSI